MDDILSPNLINHIRIPIDEPMTINVPTSLYILSQVNERGLEDRWNVLKKKIRDCINKSLLLIICLIIIILRI